MPNSVHLIPRNRLRYIPAKLRLAHEYCFFLHDECARILVEYEGAEADSVSITFKNDREAHEFTELAEKEDSIAAMRVLGYEPFAKRLILNQITMAMVSDCLHHIYEALCCLEKRKIVVALNLLRKPLTDNLLYLSWILSDEDEFYRNFTSNSPKGITSSILNGRRKEIISGALAKCEIGDMVNVELVEEGLFSRNSPLGIQNLFQHAVHLITTKHIEFQTTSENFNFIFRNPEDDDFYEGLYDLLPHVFLYLSHVVLGVFERIASQEDGARKAFIIRSILGLCVVCGSEDEFRVVEWLGNVPGLQCPECDAGVKLTSHNLARLILAESFRCASCRRVIPFSFSRLF